MRTIHCWPVVFGFSIFAAGCQETYPIGATLGPDAATPAIVPAAASPDVSPNADVAAADSAPATPLSACGFGNAPMPVRALKISQQVLADRLNALFNQAPAPTSGPLFVAADLSVTTTADIAPLLKNHVLNPASGHVIGSAPAFAQWWLGSPPAAPAGPTDAGDYATRYLNAFTSGPGGFHTLLTGRFGPGEEGRAGIFSQQDLLASTQVSARGARIIGATQCQQVPTAHPSMGPLPPAAAGATYRQRLESATHVACASACHAVFDPAGFAFGHFNDLGQYQALDNGHAIDATGTVSIDGVKTSFSDPATLMEPLANSCDARICHAREWLAFALRSTGRNPDSADEASVREVAAAFSNSGGDLVELAVAVAQSEAFLAP